MKELKLSLKRNEVKVTLTDENGSDGVYTLREMSGKDRDRYLTGMSQKIKYDGKGKSIGLKNFDGLQASLLVLTLFDETDKPVALEVIQSFPASTVNALYTESQEINALNEEAAEEVKND